MSERPLLLQADLHTGLYGHAPLLCFKFMRMHFPSSELNNPMAMIASPEKHMELIFDTLMIENPSISERVNGKYVKYSRKRGRSVAFGTSTEGGGGYEVEDCRDLPQRKIKALSKTVELSMHLSATIKRSSLKEQHHSHCHRRGFEGDAQRSVQGCAD